MAIQPLLFNPDLESIRYIAANGEFELTLDNKLKTFWLTQKQIAEMFNLSKQAVSLHVQNFKRVRSEDVESVVKESLSTASDGKTYNVEIYNHQVVIFIGYRAQVTDETVRFQRFVEEIFRQRMEAEHARALQKIKHQRAVEITGYMRAGMSQAHAEKRVDMKSSVRQLNAIVMELTDAKMIGQVLNREYLVLFGKLASELKVLLKTQNIRDELPEMHLDYLDLCEKNLIRILSRVESLSRDELLLLVDKTVMPLAENLRVMCDLMQIDLVTGRKVLGTGAQ